MTDIFVKTWTDDAQECRWDIDVTIDVDENLVFKMRQFGTGSDRAYRSAIEMVADALLTERRRNVQSYDAGWEDCMEHYGLS